ncbi:MAG: agmatinase [Gammaproteobacteria bacterium]|nr:agmatinase [Gammaproteobacteria bacterium]
MVYPRFSGISTFMRLPHVQDLEGVDFAVIGLPFDTGATYRVGARFAPRAIRDASALLRPYNTALGVSIFDRLSGVDYGDLSVVPGYLPDSHAKITEQMRAVLDAGVVPFALGGDHSVSLPQLRALAQRFGPLGLVQFDAHGDVWGPYFGDKATHGTPFRTAVEEGLIDVRRSTQIGLRGSLHEPADLEISRELGFAVFTADDVRRSGLDAVCEAVRQRADTGPCFLSFDIDFVDPALAPGTGTPEIGGFNGWETQRLVRGLRGVRFMGFDLVEVCPPYDNPGATTALTAANLVYEFITLHALNPET